MNFACASAAAAEKAWAPVAGHCRRRGVGARSRQRAGQCAFSRRVRPPRRGLAQARRHRRGSRRAGDAQARHGRACSASRKARRTNRRSWSCAGMAASAAPIRSLSSARACASIPAAFRSSRRHGMEDMKGDMAGAACVIGLMHALAARKAKVNVVGVIGLVENMPDGKAQRPATSSPRCRDRRSRSSTPTPKAASCWPTCCTTSTSVSSRNS